MLKLTNAVVAVVLLILVQACIGNEAYNYYGKHSIDNHHDNGKHSRDNYGGGDEVNERKSDWIPRYQNEHDVYSEGYEKDNKNQRLGKQHGREKHNKDTGYYYEDGNHQTENKYREQFNTYEKRDKDFKKHSGQRDAKEYSYNNYKNEEYDRENKNDGRIGYDESKNYQIRRERDLDGDNHKEHRRQPDMSLTNNVNDNLLNEREHSTNEPEYKKNQMQYIPAFSGPPDPNNTVLMARYLAHTADWAAMATVTSRGLGGPFSNVVSMSDGPEDRSSGIPYFYITPMDLSTQDLTRDNRASIVVTLAETPFCRDHAPALDSQDPRCARLILTGKVKRVKPTTAEEEFAREALFTRHPAMRTWPADHGFFLAKLKIGQIILLDQFGGAKYLDVKDYLNPGLQQA